ncbi:MAG TPA: hypothetical protein VJN42_05505 [Candidatus Acidoferrum sp.]|nr:hypothetical protein [Candidatus Acidoferrum sp.]
MLHLFFFVMTYVTDYEATAEVVHSGLLLGLLNAGLACIAAGVGAMHNWRAERAASGTDSRA